MATPWKLVDPGDRFPQWAIVKKNAKRSLSTPDICAGTRWDEDEQSTLGIAALIVEAPELLRLVKALLEPGPNEVTKQEARKLVAKIEKAQRLTT